MTKIRGWSLSQQCLIPTSKASALQLSLLCLVSFFMNQTRVHVFMFLFDQVCFFDTTYLQCSAMFLLVKNGSERKGSFTADW